jgi:hypothetical protein
MDDYFSSLEELWAFLSRVEPPATRCRRLGLHDHEEIVDSFHDYCRERFLHGDRLTAAQIMNMSRWYPKTIWRRRCTETNNLLAMGRIVPIDRFCGRCRRPLIQSEVAQDDA